MAHAVLDQYFTVYDPGTLRGPLLALATFTRTGRPKPGQSNTIHYFQQDDQRIVLPRGLWPLVQRRWPMPIVDRRLRFAARSFNWQGSLYPYQRPIVQLVRERQGGTLVAAPGSGKTIMGLALAAQWQQPTLWLVSTMELYRVALEKAQRLFRLPASAFGFIGDGEGQLGSHLTIGMVQTLSQSGYWLEQLKPRIGTIIIDEAHHSPSNSFQQIINHFPAAYRLGLSATPNRTDNLGPMMIAILGPRVVLPKRILLAEQRITLPTICQLGTQFHTTESRWAAMEKSRARDLARNRLIVQLVMHGARRRRKMLVLVERRDHALVLMRMLLAQHLRAKALISNVEAGERNRWWDQVNAGRAVVIATRLANEGLDLQSLDYLILGAAGKSPVRLEQQIGRVMRTAEGKQSAEVYDLADWAVPAYAKQAQDRLAWYAQEGYHVQFTIPHQEVSYG